ncbi:MAG TPA: glycosyltransferase [Solirubrobacterales bacterium]|nr:glycosyltransferase [Solirubrobacterales bacterium]
MSSPAATASTDRQGDPAVLLIAVHSAAPGGAQAMALAQAEHFADRCSIIAAVPEGPLRERFAACGEVIAPAPSLPTWDVSPGRWALQLLRSCVDAFRLARTIRRHRVDAVLTSSTVLLAPVLAARLARVPAFAHAREWPTSRSGRAVFWLQRRCGDVVVAISGGVAARFAGRGRGRIVCIVDGITAGEGKPSAAALASPLRLCVIGSLTGGDGKGQHRAVETLAQLLTLGLDARLSVVGPVLDPAYAERVQSTADRLGVADRVELTGAVDDVPALLRAHDALLFCSSQGADVTPLVLMEALVEERPVVATDVGSVAEVLQGACGSVVPASDPAAMAAAVVELVADPERARAGARRGAERVRRHYDRVSGLEQLWREIVAESNARGRAQVPPSLIRFSDDHPPDRMAQIDR